ncbi:MAG: MerR family transcriptional regulator [Deltaproteobacteria bacterium]|nr:MerR family transcriptional regulator [Deltaproteobacteria bacterium]
MRLLEPQQLAQIEREHAGGLPARVIVEIFKPLGVRLSEATFRKYVQVGLLPRSRRVGRKGKHQGSRGLYPVCAVRRVNLIKKMMDEGLTLEEIRRSFVYYRNEIEELERVLDGVLAEHERELGARPLPPGVRRHLQQEVVAARRSGKLLVRQLERIASRLVAGRAGTPDAGLAPSPLLAPRPAVGAR